MEQRHPRGPEIFTCFKTTDPIVRRGPNAAALDLVTYSTVISDVPGTMERYQVHISLLISLGIVCWNSSLRLDLTDDIFATYPIKTFFPNYLYYKNFLPIIPSSSNIDLSNLDLNWVDFGATYINLHFSHAHYKLFLRSVGVCDWILPSLEITHQIYEGCHLLLDSHPELFDLARFLTVLNLHKILGFAWAKQQHILDVHKLVGSHETCSVICGHSCNPEAFL